MSLWPHQEAAIEQLREGIRAGHRKQILMAACGSGKTITACHLMQEAIRKGSRAMFLVDRIVLVEQTSAVLDSFGLPHGVLQAGHWRMRPYEPLQVASAQTLERRGIPEDVQLVIQDEAHCQRAKFTEYLSKTPAIVVGLTATPFTKGLGKIYSRVVNVISTNELIAHGKLKPLKYYAAQASIDTKGMKVVAGEWSEAEIEARGRAILGDIVSEWEDKCRLHFGGPRKTIVFSATVAHGEELAEKFRAAGYNFQQISYKDGGDEKRRAIFQEFAKPDSEIVGLISCEVLTKGFDCPDVQVGISARPYRKSLSSHIQQLGRVMRAYPGQEYGLWLCVARGSRVLTDRGLVPIEKVRLSDKIWDGTNFVQHGGAVCNGYRRTIQYQGLRATPGHLVHTQAGWRTFGECAREQIAITQTGTCGTPIRKGEDHFSASFMARSEAQKIHPRGLRMRDMRLSCCHIVAQFRKRKNAWMQKLRAASQVLSSMVICARPSYASALPQSDRQSVSPIWWPWNRVSILWGESRHALDHGKSWLPEARPLPPVGSDRSLWSLRAGQHSMAFCRAQSAQQTREPSDCKDAQVQARASGNYVRGQYSPASVLVGTHSSADHREVQQAVSEAEGEVWDILDAGPNNCFTCEGLLVHNCHSGNALRFHAATEDVFANGMQELDDGEHDAKVHREPTEKEKAEIRCACGYILRPQDDVCPACGKKRHRRNLVEVAPGALVEIDGNKRNRTDDWAQKIAFAGQLRQYAREHGYAEGWFAHKYRERYGCWPNDPRVKHAQPIPCSINTRQWITSKQIAWAKSKRRAG